MTNILLNIDCREKENLSHELPNGPPLEKHMIDVRNATHMPRVTSVTCKCVNRRLHGIGSPGGECFGSQFTGTFV